MNRDACFIHESAYVDEGATVGAVLGYGISVM